jgi:hypothetical protein
MVVLVVACKDPPRPPAPAAPSVLTEKDTAAHDGGVSGPGWRLPLEERWVVVRDDVARQVKPAASRWAVDPAGPEHLVVTCRPSAERPEANPAGARVEVVTGAWLEGEVARFTAAEGVHTRGRYRLPSQTCDVDVITPQLADAARAGRVVASFESDRPRLVGALTELARFLASDTTAQARLALYRDAGHAGVSGVLLMENALVRLSPERLTERFRLRLALLEALSPFECGELVRHRLDVSPDLLERLPEDGAVRWVQLTRQALGLALATASPPDLPKSADVDAAIQGLVHGDRTLENAVQVLQKPGNVPSELVCEAERHRLRAILAQPEAPRVVLMKSLVAGKTPSP